MLRDELQGGETDLADRVSERLDETRPRRPPSKFIEREGALASPSSSRSPRDKSV